jgi:hypothetical protein
VGLHYEAPLTHFVYWNATLRCRLSLEQKPYHKRETIWAPHARCDVAAYTKGRARPERARSASLACSRYDRSAANLISCMCRSKIPGLGLIHLTSSRFLAHSSRPKSVEWEWAFPSAIRLSRATTAGFGRRLAACVARFFILNCQPKRLARRTLRRAWSRTRRNPSAATATNRSASVLLRYPIRAGALVTPRTPYDPDSCYAHDG